MTCIGFKNITTLLSYVTLQKFSKFNFIFSLDFRFILGTPLVLLAKYSLQLGFNLGLAAPCNALTKYFSSRNGIFQD